jgi:3-oxoacyl-(acyl-carrier-protein) synthase
MGDPVRRQIARRLTKEQIERLRRSAPRYGMIVGALAGALYSIQSARHMIVSGAHDKLVVGVLLTLLASAAGWLAGLMLAPRAEAGANSGPPRTADKSSPPHEGAAGMSAEPQTHIDAPESGPRQSHT